MTKYCMCKHSKTAHSELGPGHWGRLNKQLAGYKDTPTSRKRFWKKFLLNQSDSDWRCNKCQCSEFKLDNLRYVEDLAKEKDLV